MPDAPPDDAVPSPRHRWLRALGLVVAAVAVALCVRTLADSWPTVHRDLREARLRWVAPVLVLSATSMAWLSVAWWRWLQAFGIHASPLDASAWYLGGELGKYLPGGVWTVVGRGELAGRAGVPRSATYTSTVFGYATMSAGAAFVCGVAGPVRALSGGPSWTWAFLPLILVVPAAVHPAVVGQVLALAHRVTKGRIDVAWPEWPAALRLTAWSVPAWVLLGVATVALTKLLRLHASPSQVVLAAVAAWIVGFLAVPVPAGVGVRELVFLGLAGLPSGTGVAVAVMSRAALVVVDAGLGLGALTRVVTTGRSCPT